MLQNRFRLGYNRAEHAIDLLEANGIIGTQIELISGDTDISDSAFNEVVEFAIQTGKISESLIQRKFRWGYSRAARMMDLLEA